ncbi:hypothetical protein Tco_1392821 [Tanacetum coccineum]
MDRQQTNFIRLNDQKMLMKKLRSDGGSSFQIFKILPLRHCFARALLAGLKEKSVTFSNPLFDSNDDFTSSDDESLSDEDVPEDNVKIYSNPLFEYDDEYISSDVNPLFDEVLEDIESNESCFSKLDEPALLVTPLFDANEDECFDPGGVIDEIDAFLDMDISTDIENGDYDSEIMTKKIQLDDLNDDFDDQGQSFHLRSWEIIFIHHMSKLSIKDRHYFFHSICYPDTIFDPGILRFSFFFFELWVAFEVKWKFAPSVVPSS